jgi:hypothetical protein
MLKKYTEELIENAYSNMRESLLLIETAESYPLSYQYNRMFEDDLRAARMHLDLAQHDSNIARALNEEQAQVHALQLVVATMYEYCDSVVETLTLNRIYHVDISELFDMF